MKLLSLQETEDRLNLAIDESCFCKQSG